MNVKVVAGKRSSSGRNRRGVSRCCHVRKYVDLCTHARNSRVLVQVLNLQCAAYVNAVRRNNGKEK